MKLKCFWCDKKFEGKPVNGAPCCPDCRKIDIMGEAKKQRMRESESEDYSIGGSNYDARGRMRF
jgi:hypothetical protein